MNKPSSGTYGEKADLASLQAALPQSDPLPPGGGPQPVPPMPPPPAGLRSQQPAAPGLPPALLRPTRNPDTPVNTPLEQPAQIPEGLDRQRRMLLQVLAERGLSAETREWAKLVLALVDHGIDVVPNAAPPGADFSNNAWREPGGQVIARASSEDGPLYPARTSPTGPR